MKRRLIVATVLVAALGGGLASVASAGVPETTRHKICVDHQTLLPNGFCVVWDDPVPAVPQQ